ncbi:MAG: DUF4190 domain-containing protein [Acidimicrobiales bacterium]
MSDTPQGPGWWQASDGRWYPPSPPPATTPPWASSPPGAPGPTPPGYNWGPPQPRTEPLAIWSFALAIAGIPLLCACYIGLAGTIAAIPLGIAARTRIRSSGGTLTGDHLALAGIIIGAIATALAVLLFVFTVAVEFSDSSGV